MKKLSSGYYAGFVKSRFYPLFVIPAKAGIQLNQAVLDSRLRGSDGVFDFLRDHQILFLINKIRILPYSPFRRIMEKWKIEIIFDIYGKKRKIIVTFSQYITLFSLETHP